ncbi:MAG TPA: hypothetical protein VEQ36_17435 [Thermomicrobiales bacterium]|nr:hypothetical protein [Thermomicrobiales bacterium]
MGNSRYSSDERKAIQDAHEARMAQFEKTEAGGKARREEAEKKRDTPKVESGGQRTEEEATTQPE